MSIPAGRTIGSIVIEQKISSGVPGELYLGRQPGLDRAVLVRRLRRDLMESPHLVERFRREARLAARIQHPNIQQVYDFFADRGDYYLALEYIEGPTLRAVLEHAGKFPVDVAAHVVLEVLSGLEEIQRRGVVHCDLCPENILLNRWGELKITGLGSAREAGDVRPPDPLEITAYTAPELELGDPIDGRADIYALGTLLCELLTGTTDNARLRPTRLLRAGLSRIIQRCREERPAARPALSELHHALRRRAGHENEDSRIVVAAWLWEIRMLRPEVRDVPAADAPEAGTSHSRQGQLSDSPPGMREVGSREAVAPISKAALDPPPFLRRRPQLRTGPIGAIALAAVLVLALLFGLAQFRSSGDEPLPDVASAPPALSAPAPPPQPGPRPVAAAPAQPARISFVVVPWAEIRIGQEPAFFTPRAAPLELSAGHYELVMRHPAFGEFHETLDLRAGETRVIRHIFQRDKP